MKVIGYWCTLMLCAVVFPRVTLAQPVHQPTAECVTPQIESLMREIQGRYEALVEFAWQPDAWDSQNEAWAPDAPTSLVVWPPRSEGEWTPPFPPDGYYRDAIRQNPGLAVELVRSCHAAVFGGVTCAYGDTEDEWYRGSPLGQFYLLDRLPNGAPYGLDGVVVNQGTPQIRRFSFAMDSTGDFAWSGSPTGFTHTCPISADNACLMIAQLELTVARFNRLCRLADPRSCLPECQRYAVSLTAGVPVVGDNSSMALHIIAADGAYDGARENGLCQWEPVCTPGAGWRGCPQNPIGVAPACPLTPYVYEEVHFLRDPLAPTPPATTGYSCTIKFDRGTGQFQEDFRDLDGQVELYFAVEPYDSEQGTVFPTPNSIEGDGKLHLVETTSSAKLWQSELYGKIDTAPSSHENIGAEEFEYFFPTPTSTQRLRQRGWYVVHGHTGQNNSTQVFPEVYVVLSPKFNTDPSPEVHGCSGCGLGGYPASPAMAADRSLLSWSMPNRANGVPVGNVVLHLPADASANLSPTALDIPADFVAIGDLQAWPVTIQSLDASYPVRGEVNAIEPQSGLRIDWFNLQGQTPYSSTTVLMLEDQTIVDPANPTQSTTGLVINVATTGQCESTSEYRIASGDTLELATGVSNTPGQYPLRRERIVRTSDPVTQTEQEIRTVVNPDSAAGTPVSRSRTKWKHFAWGREVIEEAQGAANDERVTQFFYDDVATINNSPNPRYRRLYKTIGPSGAWMYNIYAADGSLTQVASQYLDGALNETNPTANSRWQQTKSYSVTVGGPAVAVETVEFIGSSPVQRSFTVTFTPGSNATSQITWNVRCVDPTPAATASAAQTFLQGLLGHEWDGSQPNLVTVSEEEYAQTTSPLAHAGRPLRVLRPDGTLTLYTYSMSALNGAATTRTTTVDTGPAATATTLRTGFGQRSITIVDALDNMIEQQTLDLSGSSPVELSKTEVQAQDDFGRPTSTSYSDGGTSTVQYGCCGIEATTNQEGVTTWYTHDLLKRTIYTIVETGPATTDRLNTQAVYDAEGRVTSELRKVGSNYEATQFAAYDLAGEMVGTARALADTTTVYLTTYTSNRVISTTILPDPDGGGSLGSPTTIEERYPDGTLERRHGGSNAATRGAYPVRYEYGLEIPSITGLNLPAMRFTKEIRGDFAGSGSHWTKSYRDALGRPVLTVLADGSFSQMVYDNQGRMWKQIDPEGRVSVMRSGHGPDDRPAGAPINAADSTPLWTGSWQLTAQLSDLEDLASTPPAPARDTIDFAGSDRISLARGELSTKTYTETVNGQQVTTTIPVRKQRQWTWTTNGNSTAVFSAGYSESSLDGQRSWQTVDGQVSSSAVIREPAEARRTTRTTMPTGQMQEQIHEYGRLVQTTSYTPTGAIARRVNTVYDALRRVSESRLVKDVANATLDAVTSYEYDIQDRITTQTDPEPNPSSPVGRHTTTFVYDLLDRRIEVHHGSNKVTHTNYLPTGEVESTWGFGVTPVRHVYDDQGRMAQLKTYKDWTAQTGEAITTWNYDPGRGWLNSKTYTDGKATEYSYRPSGRLASRRWSREANGSPLETVYGYDVFGQPASTVYSDDTPAVTLAHDRRGRLITVHDAAGVRTLSYDDLGRQLGESVAADAGTGHDLLSGLAITNHLDTVGLNTYTTYAVGGSSGHTWRVDYDHDASWRVNEVKKDNHIVRYTYDERHGFVKEMQHFHVGSGNSETHVADGRREVDNLGRVTTLEWDRLGSSAAALQHYGYSYDGFSRRTSLSLVDGSSWLYSYDDMGQLTDAKHLLPAIPGGPPAEYASGDIFEYTFDDIGNRTSIGEGGDASAGDVYQSDYESNELNQYTQREVSGNIEINGYSSSAGMLVGVQEEGESPDVFAPARHGDFYHRRAGPVDNSTNAWLGTVLISELPPPGLQEWSYQMFLPQSPEVFSYDTDGNLTQDGIWNYEWDGENRLKAMWMRTEIAELRWASGNEAWVRLEFAYDWMGRRISKKFLKSGTSPSEVKDKGTETIVWGASHWTKYIYDGAAGPGAWHLMASYSSSLTDGAYLGTDQSFAWGPDLSDVTGGAGGIGGLAVYSDDAPSGGGSPIWGMFPTFDPQGNIEAVYDSTAATQVAGYEYGPFGETRSVSGSQGLRNPFRWSSKFTDGETGLVYYGHRYYSLGSGRWLNRDPLSEAGGLHLYASCANRPTSLFDPLGESFFLDVNLLTLTFPTPLRLPFLPLVGVNITAAMGVNVVLDCSRLEMSYLVYFSISPGVSAAPSLGVSTLGTSGGAIIGLDSIDEMTSWGWQIGVSASIFGSAIAVNGQLIGGGWLPFDVSGYGAAEIGLSPSFSNPAERWSPTVYAGVSYSLLGKTESAASSSIARLLCGVTCGSPRPIPGLQRQAELEDFFEPQIWRLAARAAQLLPESARATAFAQGWFGDRINQFTRNPAGFLFRAFFFPWLL